MAFILFGDHSVDAYSFLANFCHHSSPSLLSKTFLDQVSSALCREVYYLSNLERNKIPHFASIEDLNERYHDRGIKHAGVEGALLCITQLAHYLEYVSPTVGSSIPC